MNRSLTGIATVLSLALATSIFGGSLSGHSLDGRIAIDFATASILRPAPSPAEVPGARAVVEQTIRDSIGWALTKDRARLESIMAHDTSFFIFHPDSESTVRGWDAFEKMIPQFMDERFKATHFEVSELSVTFSRSGDVAWYSAMLDDCGEWNGKPLCWKDTRWTGVLERRDGRWLIVQMHFSFAKGPG